MDVILLHSTKIPVVTESEAFSTKSSKGLFLSFVGNGTGRYG